METMDDKKFKNIISAFKTAHHEKENIQVSDNWQIRVMNNIREDNNKLLNSNFFDLFQQFVWRLTPVFCVLVLLLGILITRIDFMSDYELAKIFISDPSDLSFMSLYNG